MRMIRVWVTLMVACGVARDRADGIFQLCWSESEDNDEDAVSAVHHSREPGLPIEARVARVIRRGNEEAVAALTLTGRSPIGGRAHVGLSSADPRRWRTITVNPGHPTAGWPRTFVRMSRTRPECIYRACSGLSTSEMSYG